MGVKSRISELNSRLASTLTEKGIEATADETTTSLISKVGQIAQGSTVEGIVFPKEYFTLDTAHADFPYVTITADMLDGMNTIYYAKFAYMKLQKIELPNTLTSIHQDAFYSATIKQPIVIPDSVLNIQTHAFRSCNIAQITFGKNVTNLGSWMSGCTAHTMVFNGDVLASNQWMFAGMNNLANVSFGGKIYDSMWVPIATLTPESIQNIIDALADLTDQETKTLTLHANYVLTDDQKAAITLKNWTLVQ